MRPSWRSRHQHKGAVPVRVIEYRLEGVAGADDVYRLITTILDERIVSSRSRRNPRKVKRKMSTYPVRPPCEPEPQRIDYQEHIRVLM